MCGQDLTKTRVTRSIVMGSLESNKRYQIARTWRGSMSMNVTLVFFRLSSSYIRSTKQFIHFLSFSQKAIMVLIMLELHKPFWVLIYFTHVALFLNNCLWVSFAHLPSRLLASCVLLLSQACILDALQARVLDVFLNSCCSFKLAFLMFFWIRILDALQAYILAILLRHILVVLFDHVLVAPSL